MFNAGGARDTPASGEAHSGGGFGRSAGLRVQAGAGAAGPAQAARGASADLQDGAAADLQDQGQKH